MPEDADERGTARSSIGGAANAGGESFRADLAARIGIHMLAQSPLWNHSAVDAVPLAIQCEAAEQIDDIAVRTRSGRLLFQAKGDAHLGPPPNATIRGQDSAFVKAIAQLVAQQNGRADARLDVSTDRFVLAFKNGTDDLQRLKRIAERVAMSAEIPADESDARLAVLRSEPDRDVFFRFERVIEQLVARPPTWVELVELLRLSIFWFLPEGVTQRIEIDPGFQLRGLLVEGQSPDGAINVLSREMLSLAAAAAGIDAEGLRRVLVRNGLQLQAAPDFSRDLALIAESTRELVANMRRLQRGSFGATLDRGVPALMTQLESGPTVVLGERGVGKSNLLLAVFDELRRQQRRVVLCDLKQATSSHLLTSPIQNALTNPIADLMGAVPERPAYLLIDGLEEMIGDSSLEKVVLSLLGLACRDRERWRVLVTCRESTFRGRWEWRSLFLELPIAGRDASVRHLLLSRLTYEQLDLALANAPAALGGAILADPVARSFLSLPESLALLFDLPPDQQTPALFASAILDRYWERRVASPDRAAVVIRLAREQRATGASSVPLQLLGQQSTIVDALASDGVLVVAADRVSFAHEPLADYVRARFPDE